MYINKVHYNVNDELKSADSQIATRSAVSLTSLLATGFDFHQSGALDSALSCYHEILLIDDKNFDALQLIGAAHLAKDAYLEAAEFFGKALRLNSSDPAVLVNMASALKGLGDPAEAIVFLERALALDPENFDANYNKGNIHRTNNDLAKALICYERAAKIRPSHVGCLFNLASTLRDSGDFTRARDKYRHIQALDPHHYEAIVSEADLMLMSGDTAGAERSYKSAMSVRPDYLLAYSRLAELMLSCGDADGAIKYFRQALRLDSITAIVFAGLGRALLLKNRPNQALPVLARAVMLEPTDIRSINMLAIAHLRLGQYKKCSFYASRALELDANNVSALESLCHASKECGKPEAAIKFAERLIIADPRRPEFYNTQGVLLHSVGRSDEALICLQKSICIEPTSFRFNNKGLIQFETRKLTQALESYDRALSLEPDSAEVNWNKSLLLLLQGNYAEGWPLYEWRLKRDELSADYPQFQQPLWRGETELSGKRLLIHVEQGLGDMVQFCRFVPGLVSLGAEVILQVQKPLMPLISTLVSDVALIAKGDPLPEFDLYCPLMSLPYALGLTTETIPSFDSYLSADPVKVEDWRKKLGPSDLLRVGVVWSGRPEHKNDHNRSISLDALSPVLDLPVEWHSLQKEYRASDVDALSRLDQLHQHQEALSDFSDTAALIENMDLVVTVDTSVAHVACALGKPTWILLPYLSDFRWLLDRSDSPWYPSATLYRQKEPGDWSPVFAKLTEDLAEKIDAY